MNQPTPQTIRERDETKAGFLANYHETVAPSDTTEIPPSAIMNLDDGTDICLVDANGTEKIYPAVPAYFVIPLRAVKVKSTGTTSTNMVRYT